jgi:hypothetical protein
VRWGSKKQLRPLERTPSAQAAEEAARAAAEADGQAQPGEGAETRADDGDADGASALASAQPQRAQSQAPRSRRWLSKLFAGAPQPVQPRSESVSVVAVGAHDALLMPDGAGGPAAGEGEVEGGASDEFAPLSPVPQSPTGGDAGDEAADDRALDA